MNWGIVAFIDVLGFKGLWERRISPEDELKALQDMKLYAEGLVALHGGMGGGELWDKAEVEVRAFSDTIAILAPMPAVPDASSKYIKEQGKNYRESFDAIRKYMLLREIVLILSKLITTAAVEVPPLLYRGCISSGKFLMNDFAFVGPAVDEAGQFFEAAQGAFTFLTPSAKSTFDQRPGLLSMAAFPYFVEYAVPMKGMPVLNTLVINPLLFTHEETDPDKVAQAFSEFLASGSENPSVAEKLRNTEDYLQFLKQNGLTKGQSGW